MDIKNGYPLPAGMGIFDTCMLTGRVRVSYIYFSKQHYESSSNNGGQILTPQMSKLLPYIVEVLMCL